VEVFSAIYIIIMHVMFILITFNFIMFEKIRVYINLHIELEPLSTMDEIEISIIMLLDKVINYI